MTVYDRHGLPIQEGDLLRSPHFRLHRWRKMMYLYHVAMMRNGKLYAVPLKEAIGGKPQGGCVPFMHSNCAEQMEVIEGDAFVDNRGVLRMYCERPKEKS